MLSFRSFRSKGVRAANPEPEPPAASPRAREVAALATAAREKLSAELPGQSERGEKINVVALMTEAAKLTAQVAEMAAEIEKLKAGGEGASTGCAASTAAGSTAGVAIDILKAAEKGDFEAVKSALAVRPADKEATNRFGRTPLIEAARNGHRHVVELLLEKGADKDVRNKFGQCAADFAVEKGHWMVYARLDPIGAMVKSEAVHRRFADAAVVHVLSTRSRKDASQLDRKHPAFVRMACEPTRTAENLQRYLEEVEGVRVFNPNVDNAFLLGGLTDPEAVLERKLLNWRSAEVGLDRALQTGGCVLQLIVPPGPSDLQLVEAAMARDKLVPLVLVDCTAIPSEAYDYHFEEMESVKALRAAPAKAAEAAAAVASAEATAVVPARDQLILMSLESSSSRSAKSVAEGKEDLKAKLAQKKAERAAKSKAETEAKAGGGSKEMLGFASPQLVA